MNIIDLLRGYTIHISHFIYDYDEHTKNWLLNQALRDPFACIVSA